MDTKNLSGKKIFYFILSFIASLFLMSHLSLAYNYFDLPGIKGYQPPKGYPWNFEPKTAEQIMYLADSSWKDHAWYNYAMAVLADDRKHIRVQKQTFSMKNLSEGYGEPSYLDDYGDYLDYTKGNVKQGDVRAMQEMQWIAPPEIRTRAFITWDYLDTPYVRKDADRWLYLPSARRIRRLSGGDRGDSVGGSEWTYDDIIGREVFEWEHTLLGMDSIGPEDISWDRKFWKLGIKNPIQCYVVESKPKLPDYYFGKQISWVAKDPRCKQLYPIRWEQYGKDGNLWKIYDLMFTPFPLKREPSMLDPNPDHHNTLDLKINHRTTWWLVFPPEYYGLHNKEIPDTNFQPEFLRREAFIIPEKGWPKRMPEIKSYENLPKPPRLLLDRFKEHRPIAKEVLERLKQRYGKELE